jgi:hypothetical protein
VREWVHRHGVFAPVAVHHRFVFIHHLFLWAGEKRIVKQIDHKPLQKPLQAKNTSLPSATGERKTIAARRKVGVHLRSPLRVLHAVGNFVTVDSQNGIHFHGVISLSAKNGVDIDKLNARVAKLRRGKRGGGINGVNAIVQQVLHPLENTPWVTYNSAARAGIA